MAPLPILAAISSRTDQPSIPDLAFSSLVLDNTTPAGLLDTNPPHKRDDASSSVSPIEAHDLGKRSSSLLKREINTNFVPGQGSRSPDSFNNKGFMALFALLGVAMVLASLWFFFYAKNGGFHYQQGDWDDYKSTVLRRKGPDGKTLSNATKSTKLGGSTIAGTQHYKWARQAAKSVVSYDEKGRKGIMGKRGFAKTHSITYSDDFSDSLASQTVSDMTEYQDVPDPRAHSGHHSKRYRDRDVQDYKKERPARVGGLNRVADGSHADTATNGSDIYSETSEKPILQKSRDKAKERERAERRAREDATKMERRWKKEAEEAAAALAQENARNIQTPKKSAAPTKPSATKQRASSRSASPKKRDFSYQAGAASEVLSTAYTGTTSNRTASYYDAYRPRNSDTYLQYPSDNANRSRQSSPKKKPQAGRSGGYRRGADLDLD